MAEHIHKTYTCDHCGADVPERQTPRSTLFAQLLLSTAAKPPATISKTFQFEDLCSVCVTAIAQFLTRPT